MRELDFMDIIMLAIALGYGVALIKYLTRSKGDLYDR